ncbi:MAG: sulfotransferase [Methylococcaceae bacterium]
MINHNAPILIGGVGGSGTRVITQILQKENIFMGSELNDSLDNMNFAPQFPIMRQLIQQGQAINQAERESIISQLIHTTSTTLLAQIDTQNYSAWGWKIPANFIILAYVAKIYPQMKYIHVIRHGLDMAFSDNKNQLNNWGHYFSVDMQQSTAKAALEYWIKANQFALDTGEKLLGENFLLLNFDDLCRDPKPILQTLIQFLQIDCNINENLYDFIAIPLSTNRYLKEDISIFDNTAINAVRSFGFDIKTSF